MTKKNWLMFLALAALAGAYVFYFTAWLKPKIIHISHTSRAIRGRAPGRPAGDPAIVPITFSLEPECRPTEIKVVLLAAWTTNQNVLPLWHLVSYTNVAPIKMFLYGRNPRGLKPEVPGSRAEPLQPDATYRLFLTAGSAKGQHDFQARAAD